MTIKGSLLFLVSLVAVAQTTYEVGGSVMSTYGAIDGCPIVQTISGNANTAWYYNAGQNGGSSTPYEGSVRFPVTGVGGAGSITIGVSVYQSGNALALFVDSTATSNGTLIGTSGTLAQDGTFKTTSFANLDPGHTYEVLSYLIPSGGALANGLATITITGGFIGGTATFHRNCAAIYGDSIVAASFLSGSAVDIRTLYYPAFLLAGYSMERVGAGGQKVVSWGQTSTSAVLNASPVKPTLVIHELGVNDQQAWVNAGSVSTFQTGVATELTNMATGLASGSKMLWQQVLNNEAAASDKRDTYNAAIVAGVAAYNSSQTFGVSACTYNTDGWIVPATDAPGDGLHPIVSNTPSVGNPFGSPLIGYGKINNRMSFILAGYGQTSSISVSGPTSGITGSISGTFTVSPRISGAVFSGESITPVDGAGGSFTPSTVTLTAGTTSATFTYTPLSTGVKSISFTGMPDCWTSSTTPYTSLSPYSGSSLRGGTFKGVGIN